MLNLKKTKNNLYFKNLLKVFTSFILILILSLSTLFILPKKIYSLTLKELSDQIASLSDEEEALVEEVIAVEANIDTKRNEIKKLSEQISSIEKELEELEKQRNILIKNLQEKRELLKERAIYSYKYSQNNVIKMVLTVRDINEFFTVLYLLRNIMRQEAELIESIRNDKESFDRTMRKSEEKKKEYEDVKAKKANEQKKLEASLEKAKLLLNKVKQEKSNIQQVLEAIKQRIAKIQPQGVTLTGEWQMVATAYFAGGGGLNGDGTTATGLRARKGIVAVDPKVIRLGTKLYIDGYGIAIAGDTGGWIKGNRIDLCFDTLEECLRYGRRKIYVYLVED